MEKVNRLLNNIKKESQKQRDLANQWGYFEKHQYMVDIHEGIADALDRIIEEKE